MARNKHSSQRWLDRQRKDPYVKQAHDAGWRSRAVYKLEQVDQRDDLIRPGMTVIDLGAAPGGWCQYVASKMKGQGRIVGLDLLEIEPLDGVSFLQADFLQSESLGRLSESIGNRPVDLVLSDMAPNFSGIKAADIARAYELAELAADFAVRYLAQGGKFLVKVFQGAEFEAYRQLLREQFLQVVVRKPEASRADSRELYLLARGLRKAQNE